MTEEAQEHVGSVGEEAAKLFGALADWAGEQTREVEQHIATGSAECRWCPVCRTVHAVRSASPEVRAQLAVAASSLMQAAAGLLTAVAADPPSRAPGVQRIELDDEPGPDDEEQR